MKEAPQRGATKFEWNNVPEEVLSPSLSRKLVTGDRMMMAHVILKKGCIVPAHSHENEQLTYILKGGLKFDITGEEIIIREGEVLVIPAHIVHGAVALEDTLDLDIFSPPRQDWIEKTDNYLRGK
jgi:quercetin dioxygenase-like cupin family protein